MKVSLFTLGCRTNQSESSIIEGTLKENGVKIVGLDDDPDFCIVNTCTVTSKSDYNSRQLIRRAARAGAKVIVTGCYAHLKPEEINAISGVTEVVDNRGKYSIVNKIIDKSAELYFGNYSRCRPYLKVQDGCNLKCSYCTVPLARGKSRSVPANEVIKRAKVIESKGYNEIVLTGIHLGSYGKDLEKKTNLNYLLKRILKETNIYRIRLSSLEIKEVDDELTELIQDDRVCKHLHLPLQSGSNRILKLMRRNYSAEHFLNKINKISTQVKNISIGTDVIVGFPEEEESDFNDTFRLISELPISYIHVFPFSSRPNTEASLFINMNKQQHGTVKKRMEQMKALNRVKKRGYMETQINRTIDIITEERIDENTIVGTSSNYIKIKVHMREYNKGSIIFVRPVKIINEIMKGFVI